MKQDLDSAESKRLDLEEKISHILLAPSKTVAILTNDEAVQTEELLSIELPTPCETCTLNLKKEDSNQSVIKKLESKLANFKAKNLEVTTNLSYFYQALIYFALL